MTFVLSTSLTHKTTREIPVYDGHKKHFHFSVLFCLLYIECQDLYFDKLKTRVNLWPCWMKNKKKKFAASSKHISFWNRKTQTRFSSSSRMNNSANHIYTCITVYAYETRWKNLWLSSVVFGLSDLLTRSDSIDLIWWEENYP